MKDYKVANWQLPSQESGEQTVCNAQHVILKIAISLAQTLTFWKVNALTNFK